MSDNGNDLGFDVGSVCRICLESSDMEMTSIFEQDRDAASILEKIERCSGLKLINDPLLPSRICDKCKAFLKVAHKFCIICERSDSFLREFVFKVDSGDEEQTAESESETTIAEYLVDEVNAEDAEIVVQMLSAANKQHENRVNNEFADDVDYVDEGVEDTAHHDEPDEQEASDDDCVVAPNEEYSEIWLNDNNDEKLEQSDTAPRITSTVSIAAVNIDCITKDDATVNLLTPLTKKTGDKPLHVCDICGNSYPRKYALAAHMRRHRDERPYECEICHAAFHLNFQLTRHMRKHTGDRPYKCQYCDRCFADRSTLVKHERIHRNERPYVCTTCGKNFTYSSVLKAHQLTHTGEKPFNCGICGKRFARGHHLRSHLETQLHSNDPRSVQLLKELKRDCND